MFWEERLGGGFIARGSNAVVLWLQRRGAGDLLSESARLLRAGGRGATLLYFCVSVLVCFALLYFSASVLVCFALLYFCVSTSVLLNFYEVRVECVAVTLAGFRCCGERLPPLARHRSIRAHLAAPTGGLGAFAPGAAFAHSGRS